MALCLDEFLCLSEEERRAAEKLPLDPLQRKSLLARKLTGIRVKFSTQSTERKNKCQTITTLTSTVSSTTGAP